MKFLFGKTFINTAVALYIWILGITIGALLASGAFVANVIFNASFFGVELSKFQSGILMTQIFLKLNILLIVVAFIIAIFETFTLRLGDNKKIIKIILFISGAISVICILLFSLYYTPFIVEQQQLGLNATQSSEFISMHAQSEFVANVLFFCLSINVLFRLVYRK
ncbi:DUF4149 domain-containing protein [Helicobacter sp. MIT 99-5507]|uniref:DUF4149 domain-containing protein n=1 Tax=Helicobacter sp. MIT 99-5507 TaxID=152489 RepID=UPI000E1FA291|nr:DUF4149 domain-containing protein [Helicobacter sp. MIT 99-5507]RDU57513.1 DUF4149 domain-containing protein [Helicobacter sp. MIT 99-5507]